MSDAVFSPVSFFLFVSVPETRKEDGAVLLIEHNKSRHKAKRSNNITATTTATKRQKCALSSWYNIFFYFSCVRAERYKRAAHYPLASEYFLPPFRLFNPLTKKNNTNTQQNVSRITLHHTAVPYPHLHRSRYLRHHCHGLS